MPDFQLFPLPFWLVVVGIVFSAIRAWRQMYTSLRLPMLVVLFTVTFWYVGDVLYNDYQWYLVEMESISLQYGWWEILLFLVSFNIITPFIHRKMNRKYLGRPSFLLKLIKGGGIKSNRFQDQLYAICGFLFIFWAVLMIIALVRTDFDFVGIFAPYLGEKAYPWNHARVGAGFDFLVAAADYSQIGLAAVFGIITALACRPRTFLLAAIVWFLTVPGYIFDRTRSTMLAVVLPGFLAFVFIRMRTGILLKIAVLALGLLVVESWLKFVIDNRGETSIVAAFQSELSGSGDLAENGKHAGLNMFEELGFINTFIADGSYRPNWGEEYFAEVANIVPRGLWPDKPWIGIDYAVARGQGVVSENAEDAGVGATVSTGMIGQGVVNFGRILGPIAVAILMGVWVAVLARQDIRGAEGGRLFLYGIGLVLTFNMGRDITLLVLYPVFFGYGLIKAVEYWKTKIASKSDESVKAKVLFPRSQY